MYHVYKITNKINGKFYIGVHKVDSYLESNYMGSGPLIRKAVKKYGKEQFIRESLYQYESANDAYSKEKELVDPSHPLSYNLNSGGFGGFDYINSLDLPNSMLDPEIVKKNSASRSITYNNNKEFYDEISRSNLKKAVEANTGRTQSPEVIQARIERMKEYWKHHDSPNKGIPLTEEHKRKIAESWTEDRKQEKSQWMKQRIQDNPDIVNTNKGKTFSTEHTQKMSVSMKEAWKHRSSITCPVCGLISKNASNMKRWHFENCKGKI